MLNKTTIPPSTYSEWLSCFSYMKSQHFDYTYTDHLIKGSLEGNEQVMLHFQNQLICLMNVLLEKKTRRFVKNMNHLLEVNELDNLTLLFRRFKREIDNCLFFTKLEFLSPNVKLQLKEAFMQEAAKFLDNVINHLKIQSAQNNIPELEDALYQLRRIRMSA